MRLTFLLPGSCVQPCGGYKVVYEYANRLQRRGYEVTLVHAAAYDAAPRGWHQRLRASAIFCASRYAGRPWRPDAWFQLDSRVRTLWTRSLEARWVPDADVVIATTWWTAEWAKGYPAPKGAKAYLIQDYEYYMSAAPAYRDRMAATFAAGLMNVVISPAVAQMLEASGAPIHAHIPVGFDFDVWALRTAIADPARSSIGFPTRPEAFKGTGDTVAALAMVRERVRTGSVPRVWSFGGPRPADLPGWVEYYRRPTDTQLCELYNSSQVFVTASHYEGWGAPGMEAMACGAALASTDHGGVQAYARNGVTALLSPIRDPVALAENILRLLGDPEARAAMAARGSEEVRQFTWDRAVASFEECLVACGGGR